MSDTNSSTNSFPVIRPVVEKYNTSATSPAQHTLMAEFFGYRAKEDITALPPGYLVSPSQNVLHLASGLIYARPGYTLDGQANTALNIEDGIISNYDWITHLGFEQHVRVHNGAMEYRWVSPTGTVSWLPLMTQTTMQTWNGTSTLFRFAENWNTTENIDEILFVNGDGNVYEWSGGLATLASVSSAALTVTSGLASAPNGEVITIVGNSQLTSFSGTTTTAGNSVLSGTITYGTTTYIVGYIIMANQPANGDTINLVINGVSGITITFVNSPYGSLTADGYQPGSVKLGYNWTYVGSGPGTYQPNLSSPNVAITNSFLLETLQNLGSAPGTAYSNFVAFPSGSFQSNYLSLLNIDSSPVVTGSTTTAGNTVSSSGQSLVFSMPNNPSNGDTVTLDLNGQSIVSTAVSVIAGASAGSFLIAGTAASTMTNYLGLLQAPTTTNTTQTAFSATNAAIIQSFTYGVSTGITLQGQKSWAQLGFMTATVGRGVIIQGQLFNYTGGETTQTLTGVTPNPTTTPNPALISGLPVVQAPMVSSFASFTGVNNVSALIGFSPNLIASLATVGGTSGNSVFYGSTTRRDFYQSKAGNYQDITFSDPRLPTDGYGFSADGAVTAFIVQEQTMYVSAGADWWYTIDYETSTAQPSSSVAAYTIQLATLTPLKNSPGQGAQSQEAVFKVKNSVFVITQEPAIDDLGRIADDLALPEAQTLTDSIKNDFLLYDLTGAYGIYIKYFLYIVLPAESKMLVYNFFQSWWEPPQVFPFGRLSIINGDLYAHSSQVPETYRVFIDNPLDPNVVYNDNGNPINCIAAFSYNNFGTRDIKKQFTELFVEGYIKPNTTLTCASKFDFGGYSGLQTYSLSGAVPSNLIYTYADNSLGKVPLGKNPIGSITDSISNTPKFRHIFTGINIDFFEYQQYFQTNGIDQQWQLLAVAVNQVPSNSGNNEIKT